MSAGTQTSTTSVPAADLKSGTFTLPTLCMSGLDPDAIDKLLFDRVARAPNFFRNTPVVIDLTNSHDTEDNGDLALAIGAIRGYGLVPVGVRGATKRQNDQARIMELAVFPPSRPATTPTLHTRAPKPESTPPLPELATKIIRTPVRSGQRIYAKGCNLILLAQVSSGAEVVADGHVHAYAPIRGRVLAGVLGNKSALIFCKDLNAELISIAGHYKVNEDLDPRFMGRLISVSLDGNTLIFKKL
ncbi:MAG: septum site-determining protein MinC [Candidatus Thiodiazotropha sp.]|jgi:septum site-determining protein MinC